MTIEVPSDDEVVAVLEALGERVTARALCMKLIEAGHPVRESQIAIQRAAERGRIQVNDDLSMSPLVVNELAVA
jgi:hypothetical protein